jgi:pimeloyl-ACP methyl ester carboxylesterase
MRKAALTVFFCCVAARPAAAQQISWENFAFDAPTAGRVTAERGWLDVPVHHDRGDTGRIRIPVVRLKSTNAAPGPPIVFLAGGPGNAGTRLLTGPLYPHAARLAASADVIAFDQRGAGSSEPSLAVPGRLELPSGLSIDSAEAHRRLTSVASTVRTTISGRGIDLNAYNPLESAEDVELLRRALGADRIVLWAHSYGTHLALAVLKRHGDRVARAILGGVNGLDDRWREPAEGDAWLARVAAAMRASAPSGAPDLADHVRRVLAQLEKEPLRIATPEGEVFVGKSEIQLQVTAQSGDLGFVEGLPVFFDSLDKRVRLQPIAEAVQRVIRQRPIGTAMTYAMHVASGVSRQRRDRIAAQAPAAVFGNAINWGFGDEEFVRVLGVSDLGDEFRAPFRSDVPVLFISGTLDGRTSEADARNAGAQFSRATYITLEGASHDFFFLRPPARFAAVLEAFARGEPVSNERIAWPVTFKWPEISP